MKIRCIYRVMTCLALLSFGSMVEAAVYDLKSDWSNIDNPNGPWALRQGSTPLPWVPDIGSIGLPGQGAWVPSAAPGNFLPIWWKAAYNGAPFGYNYLANDIVTHSQDFGNGGSNGPGNVAWTSPVAGTIDIAGSLWSARSFDLGRANEWAIYLNGNSLASGTGLGISYTRAAPLQLPDLNDIAIGIGDVVELRIFVASGLLGDAAGVNLTITTTEATSPIPEPASIAVLATGAFALGMRRRRQARRTA